MGLGLLVASYKVHANYKKAILYLQVSSIEKLSSAKNLMILK